LLSEPVDVSKFALIYANAECGLGISGLTILILRDDLTGGALNDTPRHLNYKYAGDGENDVMAAPVWSVYIAKLVFEWIKSLGGLEEMKRRNERKASVMYDYLDSQTYYTAPVDKKCRSMMNVVFITGDASLDRRFAEEAKAEGLLNLGGHSSVGGMRASIYNAMPMEGVEKLVEFMRKFSVENPKIES
jgi:phosphoserine aminotransferase